MSKGPQWERWGIIGTTKSGEAVQPPKLLTANCVSAHEAQKQCKHYADQGWGVQVLSLAITAQAPRIP